jgi:hypothetical protein
MTLAVFSFWNDPETGARQSFMDGEGRTAYETFAEETR